MGFTKAETKDRAKIMAKMSALRKMKRKGKVTRSDLTVFNIQENVSRFNSTIKPENYDSLHLCAESL